MTYVLLMQEKNSTKTITIRLPAKDYEAIEKYVSRGYAMNASDFIRKSVMFQLMNMGGRYE